MHHMMTEESPRGHPLSDFSFHTSDVKWAVAHTTRGRERRNSGGGGCDDNLQQHLPQKDTRGQAHCAIKVIFEKMKKWKRPNNLT